MMHRSTLSSESKQALQTGNLKKMSNQFRKLDLLYMKGTASNKGTLHRHVIAMKHAICQYANQHIKPLKQFTELLDPTMDTEQPEFCEPSSINNEWESLSKRHMRNRKHVRFNTKKRVKTANSLEKVIYKRYYMKLTKLTKMRESLPGPSFTTRAIARSNGMWLESEISYKERFRNLMFKVVAEWRPRDFIQRLIGSEKVHSLCINIIHYISVCTSSGMNIMTHIKLIDNLFRILRRFKVSSPVFRRKRVYRGGGPKKCVKHEKHEPRQFCKQDGIGQHELPMKVVNTLSAILRGQFDLEYGLVNVRKLYRASKMTAPVSQKLKCYNLQLVPIGSNAVQVHYCDNHYVTSEQRQGEIIVWDSLQTTEQFKADLYSQLQLTYDKLSEHQYNDQPEGLVTYKNDELNMQRDSISCGIFAIMRAFFVLSNTSSKINTDIARSYLSRVLARHEFSDYDLFSSQQRNVKMQVIMENYMSNQKELQTKKSQEAISDNSSRVSKDTAENAVRKRGRPKKRKYPQEEEKGRSDTTRIVSQVTASPVRKRGRPSIYSPEERKQRIKENRQRHYLKTKGTMNTAQNMIPSKSTKQLSKRGRPAKHSPAESIMKNREKSLRHYHKFRKDKPTESVLNQDKHKENLKRLRSNTIYKEKEKLKDKERHESRRNNPLYREEERHKDREAHKDMRKNPTFRDKERAKERQWHKDMRENLSLRATERDKDREAHKVLRENPAFRATERDKDREAHKDMRENQAFRDKERERERQWHKENRSDPVKRAHENVKARNRKYGQNEAEAIKKYLAAIQTGPCFVCTCCLQLWFSDNCTPLDKLTFPNPERVAECKTGTLYEDREWLCSTCVRHLKEDRIPPISQANGVRFYDIPEELNLVQMEERCVALRQPFCQIRELPNGGQKSIKGNVVNVPMDVGKTINQLPRDLNETETIGIKFKKKLSYKKCDCENIRPQAVIRAAKYLVANSELYQAHNVTINDTWQEKIASCTDDSLTALMGLQDSDNKGKPSSSPNIIEIDLTMSDDDVLSVNSECGDQLINSNSAQQDNAVATIKNEKIDTSACSSQLVDSSSCDKVYNENLQTNDKNSGSDPECEDDRFSEIDEMENYSGNMDTMLDSPILLSARATNRVLEPPKDVTDNTGIASASSDENSHVITDGDALVIAPGEGQHPISLFNDPDAEYLSFPAIYCGQRRPVETECKSNKKPSKANIFKWECRAKDRRVATCIPDLFFKYKCLQIDAVENVVGISMRKVKGKKQPTAGELRTPEGRDRLVNQNEGLSLYKRMRNTPPYYGHKKKNLLAVVRQEGMPALFFTQSCADTRWPELLKVLGKLIDQKDYSDEEVESMSPQNRNRLVAADPVTVVRYFENKCHKFQQHIMNLKGSSRRFIRREFQNRGSPHSHEIHWIAGAPVYDPDNPDNDKNVTEFIDTWISTKTEVTPEEEKYLKYQVHKHTNSCRKRGEAICRFGIPFFPMKVTCILKPLECDEVSEERLDALKNAYHELRKRLNDMGVGSDITHEEFLQDINMTESDYILTIRSSLNTAKVFYQRKPNALRVNPYMKGMLSVIKANHDVQYPLNIYALVCYVVDYLLKSQKGLSATLEQAVRDAMDGDMKLKQQIRHIGYNLLGAIETSAAEAAYYIMQIPFTYCSVEVVFIPTSPPEERLYVLKSEQELSELPEGSRDVLKSNKIAAYGRRPRELENWCLADYVSELTVEHENYDDHKEHDSAQNLYDCDEQDEDIIDEDSTTTYSSEDIFPLKSADGRTTFKKRKTRRVIRFVNYNRLRDEENYCREKLLLYKPWRKEDSLIGRHESYAKAFDEHVNVIRHNMIKYEKFTDEVKEAEEMIENADNDEAFDQVAPGIEQEERDAELIGPADSPEYRFFSPPKKGTPESCLDTLYNAGVSGTLDVTVETMSRFLPEYKYLDMVRSLNEKQFQIFTHVMHHVSKGNSKPLRIFITGGAGVGKSMVLRCIYQGLLRLIAKKEGESAEDTRIIIATPTGKSAYLVHGATIHSTFKLLPNHLDKEKYVPLSDVQRDALKTKFKNLHTVIIDEVSMVGKYMFRDIDLRLREIMGIKHKPFGGLNVIVFGDLFQLSPVMDGWIFENLGDPPPNKKAKLQSADALAPNIWKEDFSCFELTQVMRQRDDQPFCEILNRMREGNQTKADIKVITDNCELRSNVNLGQYKDIPHFFYTNGEKDDHNRDVLMAKYGKHVSVKAIDICTQTNLPAKEKQRILDKVSKLKKIHLTGQLERVLDLKRGLPYDITINIDVEDGLTNGTSVILRHMLYLDGKYPDIPSVLLVEPEVDDGYIGRKTRNKYRSLLPLNTPVTWVPLLTVNSQFMYSHKHPITRQQFPLSMGAAKTLNKSQGYTLNEAVVAFPGDKKGDRRVAGLHYVGLSRVTKMSGITILPGKFNADKIHVSEAVKQEMLRLRSQGKLQLCYTPLSNIASNFIVSSFNAQSLHKHMEDVKNDWNMKAASVLGICETRLKQGEDVSRYQIENYTFHHAEQSFISEQRPYHGLALYVRKHFKSKQIFSMCTDKFECMAVDIYIPSKVLVVMCYKQPRTPNHVLFTKLQEVMEHVDMTKPVIIMGDFNVNKLIRGTLIANMSQILHCRQIISDITTKSNTCIDLIFTNMEPTACGSIFTAVSHHHLTYAAFDNV